MRRQLLTLALTGLFGAVLLSSDASACHKKRCKAPATCTVVAAPCPPPAPVCAPAPTCHQRKRLFGGLCHKKKACPAPVVYAAPAPCNTCATPTYAAPAYPSYQSVPSAQGY